MILLAIMILIMLATASLSADINALRKKAEAGDPEAQYILGVMYGKGQVVRQNSTEAIKWYRKSAEKGNAEAHLRPEVRRSPWTRISSTLPIP